MKQKEKLTQKRLKELLHYDSETGIFVWRERILSQGRRSLKGGNVAGCKEPVGYIQIQIDGKLYRAHRLAWLYSYGYFPENAIDHIDRFKYHNWMSNLREVSRSCNIKNTGNPKDNTSGVKGVHWSNSDNVWVAQIAINRNPEYLGGYKSFGDAVCARLAGEQCLGWEGCDSSSPAYQYVQKNIIKKGAKE